LLQLLHLLLTVLQVDLVTLLNLSQLFLLVLLQSLGCSRRLVEFIGFLLNSSTNACPFLEISSCLALSWLSMSGNSGMAEKISCAFRYAIFKSCAATAIGAKAIKKIKNFFNMISVCNLMINSREYGHKDK